MKVVIIGAGIAGVTLGVLLNNKNTDVVICERFTGIPTKGHAFLMHSDGLSILKDLNKKDKTVLPGNIIDTFSLKTPEEKELKRVKLDYWKCIKRSVLIRYLYSLFPGEKIKGGREFSHFIRENGRIVAAAFENGEIEYGDIFVGADGGNSRVRESIHGNINFTPVEVKEMVGVCYNEDVSKTHVNIFTKYQNRTNKTAFGFIPTSGNEFVWFIQYNGGNAEFNESDPGELKSHCYKLLEGYPSVVFDILDSNDFSGSYVWKTRDFDLLPSFHQDNVALIGDAAHLALPFTSAGTTNAIMDARTLSDCLGRYPDYEDAFRKFYDLRHQEVSKHIQLGRDLKDEFLHPKETDCFNISVPLINPREDDTQKRLDKPVQILYFTDPICSTCWIIQPLLRKLEMEYGDHINVKYCVGGLLPTWEGFDKGQIKKPSDAAKHWEEVCSIHEMPLDGDIWYDDPLYSSYPPSIAFKAAQMQDTNLAILFLRRIKEMLFIEKKNIIRWEHIEEAAFKIGLDTARLLIDFEGKAQELFNNDLKLRDQLGIKSFPTLVFSGNNVHNLDKEYTLNGYQPYERFEEIIRKLVPDAHKNLVNTEPEHLFSLFPTMTTKEFEYLNSTNKNDSYKVLADLYLEGSIDKYESKNGIIWISKYEENLKAESFL
ncbi:MAG: DsbA family protein [Balneolales bacterium]